MRPLLVALLALFALTGCDQPSPTIPSTTSTTLPSTSDAQLIRFYEGLQTQAFLEAVAVSIAPGQETWLAIGRCEQPGDGYGGVNWTQRGSRYSGGLGFANSTWTQFRLPGMPASAGDASPFDQMRVASVLWHRYGFSPWGCRTVL